MSYLVEYRGQEGNVSILHRLLGRLHFPANPQYKGRRVVEVSTSKLRDEILAVGNPHGINPQRYCEPTDLLSLQDKSLMLEILVDVGLLTPAKAKAALPAVEEEAPEEPEKKTLQISAAGMELAVDAGIDPTTIEGTGKDGNITKGDVQAHIDATQE
tara:strand:- start:132 stop:602 length:471 start_codon:yes stop_codon:yes gene_type:complete